MKVVITYVTGQAPNLPWWRLSKMTDKEIEDYNNSFFKRETVEDYMLDPIVWGLLENYAGREV